MRHHYSKKQVGFNGRKITKLKRFSLRKEAVAAAVTFVNRKEVD